MIARKKTIETERTILREFKLGDEYEMFSNWASDPEVVKYLTWPIHENIEVTRSIIQRIYKFIFYLICYIIFILKILVSK